eukprot:scaffold1505_cov118-Cylindrotheca_fusiformis.AAC.5
MLCNPLSSPSIPFLGATTTPQSSCGMEDRLIIQRPPCESASFDWSDFPIIEQDSYFPESFTTTSDCEDVSTDSTMEDTISTASLDTDLMTASATRKPRVQFSASLEVRTHSVVLGNHPLCSALPVELGWEYNETERIDLELHESNKFYYGGVRRRSYVERKRLLSEFVDESELEVDLQMKKTGPSSRQLAHMS